MARNYVSSGDTIQVVLGAGQTAEGNGKALQVGQQLGVVLSLYRGDQPVFTGAASAQNDVAVVQLRGRFTLPKAAPLVIAQGDRLYWDNTNKVLNKTASGNVFAGFAAASALSAATTVEINLWAGDSTGVQVGTAVANLAGSMTGTVDGTIADIAAINLTGNTAGDINTGVNAAITAANLQLKELQTKLNALLDSLRTAGIIAS